MSEDPPRPFVPAEVDLRGMSGFMLDVDRLLASELVALGTPEECWAAVMLWCRAWKQKPAASLPDDDRVLAAFSGAGKRWAKVRTMALRGFIKCSDGRLYHLVLAAEVMKAWKKRQAYQADQKRLKRWRATQRNDSETTLEMEAETDFKTDKRTISEPEETETGTGTGTGTGQKGRTPNGVVAAPSADDLVSAVEGYNAVAKKLALPLAAKLTDERKRKLRQRLREHGLEAWRLCLVKLAGNRWMHGENDRGWRADFDFLLQSKSFIRLLEGGYDHDDARANGHDVSERARPTAPPPAYLLEGDSAEGDAVAGDDPG